jgi:hypothetical protein
MVLAMGNNGEILQYWNRLLKSKLTVMGTSYAEKKFCEINKKDDN